MQQPNSKRNQIKEIQKQPKFNSLNTPEDLDDEPLPMEYTIASINKSTNEKNSKKLFQTNLPQSVRPEETKGNEITEEEENEIQIPFSNQIKRIKNFEEKICIKNNDFNNNENKNNKNINGYEQTSNNFSNFTENLNFRNVNSFKNTNIIEVILLGDEEEDKPINYNEIKKYSLNSMAKITTASIKTINSNESGNQIKNPIMEEQADFERKNLNQRNFDDLNNLNNQNVKSEYSSENKTNGKSFTKFDDRDKTYEKNQGHSIITNNNYISIPNNGKYRTASQKRFDEEFSNNIHFNKENNPNNIVRNYKTLDKININNNLNSAPLIKNPVLNNIEKNIVEKTDIEPKSIKSANLWESSMQPKKGDLTPGRFNLNNENEIKEKFDNSEEKEYIGTITLSELEKNASVNVGNGNVKKNATMNDLTRNSFISTQINNNQNFEFINKNKIKNNNKPKENIHCILKQNKTATYKDNLENPNQINNCPANNQELTPNVNDQTTNFFEFRKFNDNNLQNNYQNLKANFSPNGYLAPHKSNPINRSGNNSANNSYNISRSEINLTHNITQNCLKTQNSKMLLTESKYSQFDTQNLCYELIKDYSHLKIDKDEDFMRRMLFDIYKRQTKEERMEKLIEQNKLKLDESERIKGFNRLIEDANRRIEAQDHMEEMKIKLEMNNFNSKKYKLDEWEEIYQDRFLNYQKNKDQWVEERQREKKELEALLEQEVIENCKTIKKPKVEIEHSVQRMYNEAERRLLKMDIKKNKNKMDDNKIDIEDFIINNNLQNKEPRSVTPTVFRPMSKNIKKQSNNYQFQSDISGNENSEDESKKLFSNIKAKNERNSSNSAAKKQTQSKKIQLVNQNFQIKESLNEDLEEPSVDISYANNPHKKIMNFNNNNNKNNNHINNKNQKSGWNNLYNSKNFKYNSIDNRNISNNNTEINNKRFEVDQTEIKRNIVSGGFNRINNEDAVYCDKVDKTNKKYQNYKSKNNDPINNKPGHTKNLQDYEKRIFADEKDDFMMENKNYNGYAFKNDLHKKPSSIGAYNNYSKKNNIINKGDQNSKHMPHHLASKLVDEILNSKFSVEDKPIIAYVSLPEYEIAKKIATILVEKRLVACAKIINNLESFYIWEDKLNIDKELYLMLKTSDEKVNEIKSVLDSNHPYKVYEFIYFDVKGGNEKYFEWMSQVLTEAPKKLDH